MVIYKFLAILYNFSLFCLTFHPPGIIQIYLHKKIEFTEETNNVFLNL